MGTPSWESQDPIGVIPGGVLQGCLGCLQVGRGRIGIMGGTAALASGSSVEFDFQPTGYCLKIDGLTQATSSSHTSDPPTSQLRAALVADAQVSTKVRDPGAPRINNWISGGSWTGCTRSNLLIANASWSQPVLGVLIVCPHSLHDSQ